MSDGLKLWLRHQSSALCHVTLYRAPNQLVKEDDLLEFLALLAKNASLLPESQLANVQSWAITRIGYDARAAYDWLVILRILKEEISSRLENQFSPDEALRAIRLLDEILTSAIIEASQLATEIQRADLLEHMIQLHEQEKQLEVSKSKFVTVAAHELKTPLTIIEGYTLILRSELDSDPNILAYLEGLSNGFSRMREIIADMIDVSLLDLKSFEIQYTPINVERTLTLIAGSVRKYFDDRQVSLIVTPFTTEIKTFGDEEKLMKAFTKVIMNGLKFTPDGGQVKISARPVRQDEKNEDISGYVDIQISDSGIGIDPEHFDSIFNKFGILADAKLHTSSKVEFKGGGPGLGLPIARGIIEAHGGRIWAQSPGQNEELCPGSTFHVELPLWSKEPVWVL